MSVTFYGKSGTCYAFDEYTMQNLPHISHVVYIYARKENANYYPVYIGITERDVCVRYLEHAADGVNHCAEYNGFNCMLLHYGALAGIDMTSARLEEIEKDLLGIYKTPCNIANN